jgi:hypothetical protein
MATQYVQGTQHCAHTWELLGRLVHAALQVGMYQVSPITETQDRLKTEVRKRTWWMCFIMDKYVLSRQFWFSPWPSWLTKSGCVA